MSSYRIEVWQGKKKGQKWWARVVAANGKIIWRTSEAYATRDSVMRTIMAFAKETGLDVKVYDATHDPKKGTK